MLYVISSDPKHESPPQPQPGVQQAPTIGATRPLCQHNPDTMTTTKRAPQLIYALHLRP